MPSIRSKAIVAYVPALHAGYVSFFGKHPDADIFVFGDSFVEVYPQFNRLNRDLRALKPREAVDAIRALGNVRRAEILELHSVAALEAYARVVLPDEDVSHDFAAKYLTGKDIVLENTFLRWEGHIVNFEQEPPPDRVISTDELDRELMQKATNEAQKSADWWRQIGSVLVKDGKTLYTSHIRYFPSDHALDIFGSPRSTFNAGERPDVYISMHSEADVVAQAARDGVSLKGASLYVTTFPCINCAFLVARSGIAKLYYAKGYSRLDAEDVLKKAGVEIILVKNQA